MNTRIPSLEEPIGERIAWARNCLRERGHELGEDEEIASLLRRLKAAISLSRDELIRSGVSALCRDCEEHEGGSCCGAGLENHYSSTLLLVNLLLGADIPSCGLGTSSCLFLGEEGCRLLARHVICINFICTKITDHVDPSKISTLREKEGEEVRLLFLLHERIKSVLRGH